MLITKPLTKKRGLGVSKGKSERIALDITSFDEDDVFEGLG